MSGARLGERQDRDQHWHCVYYPSSLTPGRLSLLLPQRERFQTRMIQQGILGYQWGHDIRSHSVRDPEGGPLHNERGGCTQWACRNPNALVAHTTNPPSPAADQKGARRALTRHASVGTDPPTHGEGREIGSPADGGRS